MNTNLLLQHDPDANLDVLNEGQDVYNCKYYSTESFKTLSQNFTNLGLSIICFNIRSFHKNSDEFLAFIHNTNHTFEVIILTETWSKEETHTSCHIRGYNSVHNFRTGRRGGGVSIFVKEYLNFDNIDALNISNNDFESAGLRLSFVNSDKPITIMGIYRPPGGNANDFIESLRVISSDNSFTSNDTIIAGDLNLCLLNEGHSGVTASFMNMMRENFFRPIITRPTRITRDTATLIDHIWVNMTNPILSGVFYGDITDHLPVFCRINVPAVLEKQLVKVTFRNMNQQNRLDFRNKLQNVDWDNLFEGSADSTEQVIKYDNIIQHYNNQCFPLMTKTVTSKRISKPWITTALHKSINTKHKLFKLVSNNNYDLQDYRRYCNTLNNLLRVARQNYYKHKFDTTKQDLKKTWSVINSVIRPGRKCANITKLYHNNQTIIDPGKIAETLNTHFSQIGMQLRNALPRRNSNNSFRKYLPPPSRNSFFLRPSTPEEVNQIIKGLKATTGNKNCLAPLIIKENSQSFSQPVSIIFNTTIAQGEYPDPLKIACITALFKAGDKLSPNNYRPISSLPFLNKIIEKLLHKRLNSFFELNNIISENQYGFRKGISTSDAVNELLNKIYNSLNHRKYLGAVFLDLSKAFDTVPHDILLHKLEHYGVRGIALTLMKSYLSNRKQFVSINGIQSSMQGVSIGVPQGSVLGPLLFLIYINDLPRATKKLHSILFADDTTMYLSHDNVMSLANSMSEDLIHVSAWLIANCLTLNINKTYYIVFSHRQIPNDLRVTIGPHLLDRKTHGKFLGVFLDEKLTFKEHIDSVTSKTSKICGLLFRLRQSFPLDVLRNLYQTLIYPYLNYCILAWGCASKTTLMPIMLLQKKLLDYYLVAISLLMQVLYLSL